MNCQGDQLHQSQLLTVQNQTEGIRSTFLKFMEQQYHDQQSELNKKGDALVKSRIYQNHLQAEDGQEEEENECYQKQSDNSNKKIQLSVQSNSQIRNENLTLSQNYQLNYFIPKLNVDDLSYSCITQLTRSSCKWSTGVKLKEYSIQSAYIELIESSKKFIYIENQFFISSSAGNSVKNLIAMALIDRIIQAHQLKEKFKVIIFIPLLPGFEGEIDQNNSAVLKIQLHWEYSTISRGGTSIIETLKEKQINPEDYIQFYSLRQHQKSPPPLSTPVTEIIYIHSKLMIVDDEIALIGSANINDRSLNGNRDSELALIVQDQARIESQMDGQATDVAKFAHSLRVSIFMEHFGMSESEVKDPLSTKFEQVIRQRTEMNTMIYRQIFACYPDDEIETIAQYAAFKNKKDLSKYDELIEQIKGHAVRFPLHFLSQENLKVKVGNKEYIMPDKIFT